MIDYNETASQKVRLSEADFKAICRKSFANDTGVSTLEPLTNGAVNTTYKFTRNEEPFVLRIYSKDPLLCEIEREIIQLVGTRVAIPEMIYSDKNGNPYPYAIFRFVEGAHLHEIKDESLAAEISFQVGATLAKIHQITFEKAGLFGPDLQFSSTFEEGSSPYYQYIKNLLIEDSQARNRLDPDCAEKTLDFIDQYKQCFPVIHQGGVLVHSDFKPTNLLWNKTAGVTVLDWEFAHSGHGLMDFAILMRHCRDFPLDLPALEKGYRKEGCALPTDWIQRARITDIVNIVDLLNSTEERPKLYETLRKTLQMTISSCYEAK